MSDSLPPSAQLPAAPAAPAAVPPMNTLALLALVFSFVFSIAGIVCGHLALAQIKRTGEAGRELALAGLIIGYVSTGIAVLATIAAFVFMVLYLAFFATLFATAVPTVS